MIRIYGGWRLRRLVFEDKLVYEALHDNLWKYEIRLVNRTLLAIANLPSFETL